jgi:hypothetical protein
METQLRLELELEEESVRGRVIDPLGEEHEFVGWLGLAVTIDALLAAARAT